MGENGTFKGRDKGGGKGRDKGDFPPQRLRDVEAQKGKTPLPPELDTPEFRKAWDEWLHYRKEKRKPVSDLAASKQIQSLVAVGVVAAIAAIERSIANDWQGIFPNGERQDGRSGGGVRSGARVECEPGRYGKKPAIVAGGSDPSPSQPGAEPPTDEGP